MGFLENKKIVRCPKLAWQEVEENIVVVTPWDKQIHIIEGSAVAIWEAILEPKSQSELVSLITSEFEVEEEKATQDIEKFIKTLIEKGIIEVFKDSI